ncbi:MAG: hypothetical protein WBF90_15700 [Rivularia sp. (in: cyanobacteria)]
MPYSCRTQQVLNRNKHKQYYATDLNANHENSIRTLEISFYDHEIYAGKKLIACITHDHDDFVTQRWVVMINDVEIHRANTWAKCYDYIIWHYKQGTLPTQQQEEIAATCNEETSQATPTSKFEFDLRDDVVKQNLVKLGEIGCTSGKHWVVRLHAQNQLTLSFDGICPKVGSLWLVEISPLETNQSINISESCEELLDQPFDELISEEWDRLRKYKPIAKKIRTAALY